MKKFVKNTLVYGLLIIIIAIVLSYPLLSKRLYVYKDDGAHHIIRAMLTAEQIKLGQSSIVLPTLQNGFGYSWDLFYGPLTSTMLALLILLFNNAIVAYKVLVFIGLIISGLTMYMLGKRITEDKNVGVFIAVIYMASSYHLIDLYCRNNLAEFWAFVFVPLVFLGLYNLFEKEKGDYWFIIGATGLIITHNLSSVIVAIFSIIYIFTKLPYLKDKEVRTKLLISIIFIICLSSFYWFPLLTNSLTTNYQVYKSGAMGTAESVSRNGLTIKQLFITNKSKNEYSFELGPCIFAMLCFGVAAFRRITPKMKKEYIFYTIIGIIAVFMSTKYFPWKHLGDRIAIIQFPWRMMIIADLAISLVCGINLGIVIKKFRFLDSVILSLIIAAVAINTCNYFTLPSELKKPEDEFSIGYVTGRNKDCLAGVGKNEYLPSSAYKDTFYIANHENNVVVLDGSAEIKDYKKEGNKLFFKVKVNEDKTKLELPYIYYPGYKITFDSARIKYAEDENGFIGIALNKFDKFADIKVEYVGGVAVYSGRFLSILATILFIVYLVNDSKSLKQAKTLEKSEKI